MRALIATTIMTGLLFQTFANAENLTKQADLVTPSQINEYLANDARKDLILTLERMPESYLDKVRPYGVSLDLLKELIQNSTFTSTHNIVVGGVSKIALAEPNKIATRELIRLYKAGAHLDSPEIKTRLASIAFDYDALANRFNLYSDKDWKQHLFTILYGLHLQQLGVEGEDWFQNYNWLRLAEDVTPLSPKN